MKKKIGDLAVDLQQNNQGRPPKLFVWQKNLLRQAKLLQEEIRFFLCKKSNGKSRHFTIH